MAFSFLTGQKQSRKRRNTTPADDTGEGAVPAASASSSSAFALDSSAPASTEPTPAQKLFKTVAELIPRSLAEHAITQFYDAFKKVPRIAAQIAAKQASLTALHSLADKGEKPKSLPKLASPSLPLAAFSEDDRKIAEGQLASIAKAASEEQFKIIRVWREREIGLLHAQITDLRSETSRKVLEQLLAAAQAEKSAKAALKGKAPEAKSSEAKEAKEEKDEKEQKGNGAGSAAADVPAPMSLGEDAAAQAGLPAWAAHTATVMATLQNEWSDSVTQSLLLAVARAKASAQSDAAKKSKAEEKRQKEAKVAADSALDASFGRAPLSDSGSGAQSAGRKSSVKSRDSKRKSRQQQSDGRSSRGQSSGGKSGSKTSKGKRKNSSKNQRSSKKQQSKGKGRGRRRGSSSTKRGSNKRGGRGKGRVRGSGRGRGSWKRGRGRGSRKY